MYLRPILRSLRNNPIKYATQTIHISYPSLRQQPHRLLSNVIATSAPTPAIGSALIIRHSSTNSSQPSTAASSVSSTATAENIYYGTLTPKIRAVKVFSLTTSVVGLTIQPMLIEQGNKMGGIPMIVFMCGFAGLFTFVTPLLLHFVTKKYVTQITYNAIADEYTATTISFLLLRKQVNVVANG